MRMNAFAWPLALGSLLALSACNSTGAPAQAPAAAAAPPDGATQLDSGQPPRNQCNAQAVQSLVGQPYGAGTLAQALAALPDTGPRSEAARLLALAFDPCVDVEVICDA